MPSPGDELVTSPSQAEERRPTIDTFQGAAEIQRMPLAQKTLILPRKLTTFENRMPAEGPGYEYHFANLSFRLRETTTFEKKWAL